MVVANGARGDFAVSRANLTVREEYAMSHRLLLCACLLIALCFSNTLAFPYIQLPGICGCIRSVGVCGSANGAPYDWSEYGDDDQDLVTGKVIDLGGGQFQGIFWMNVYVTVNPGAVGHQMPPDNKYDYTVAVTYHKADGSGQVSLATQSFSVSESVEHTECKTFTYTDGTVSNMWAQRWGVVDILVTCVDYTCYLSCTGVKVLYTLSSEGARYAYIDVVYYNNQQWNIANSSNNIPSGKPVKCTLSWHSSDWSTDGFGKRIDVNPESVFYGTPVESQGSGYLRWQATTDNNTGTNQLVSFCGIVYDAYGVSKDEERVTVEAW